MEDVLKFVWWMMKKLFVLVDKEECLELMERYAMVDSLLKKCQIFFAKRLNVYHLFN